MVLKKKAPHTFNKENYERNVIRWVKRQTPEII